MNAKQDYSRAKPPSVYLTQKHVTRSPRPSPSVIAYYKQSKTGGGNNQEQGLRQLVLFHNVLGHADNIYIP